MSIVRGMQVTAFILSCAACTQVQAIALGNAAVKEGDGTADAGRSDTRPPSEGSGRPDEDDDVPRHDDDDHDASPSLEEDAGDAGVAAADADVDSDLEEATEP